MVTGGRAGPLAAAAGIVCAFGVAFLGFRLGAKEISGDPSSWAVSALAPTALLAGAVAGFGAGLVALAGRRLAVASTLAWLGCAVILALAWTSGKATSGYPAPVSDLPVVFVSTLVIAAVPVFGIAACVHAVGWLFGKDDRPEA